MFDYELKCPHCGQMYTMYECPHSPNDFINKDIKGKCFKCHKKFLMSEVAVEI